MIDSSTNHYNHTILFTIIYDMYGWFSIHNNLHLWMNFPLKHIKTPIIISHVSILVLTEVFGSVAALEGRQGESL